VAESTESYRTSPFSVEREPSSVPVGIVVPTRNSARTLERCLASIQNQEHPCRIVVVDNYSTDGTPELAAGYADAVISGGPERSAQRNTGAAVVGTHIVGFIDSDMYLSPGVAAEAVALIQGGAAGVIVPERSSGGGFWASVRAKERSFYDGQDNIEAPRFFRRSLFEAVGGFDEALHPGTEDWDLTIRIREHGTIVRTRATIEHDEGRIGYLDACRKKGYYALSLRDFQVKNGSRTLGAALSRPYFRRPWILLRTDPIVGVGVLALKAGEATAVVCRLIQARLRR
jgi:glycosyltransferase involved in cell wall biosynthesis